MTIVEPFACACDRKTEDAQVVFACLALGRVFLSSSE